MNKLEFNNYLEEIKKFMTKVGTFKENLETNYFEDESFFHISELHDAKNDIFWTAKCFQKMRNDRFI